MRSTKNSSLPLELASSADDKTWTVDIDAIMDNFTVVIYAITILLGLAGNGMVIWVAGFKVRPKVTNVWLVNLAVADFIFCLSRILSLVKKLFFDYWPFGVFFCKFNGFFKYTNMFCSVFLLAVISLDRAMCVWWPVFTNNRRTVSAARFISVGVWVAASVLSSPYFVYRQVYLGKNNLSKCSLEVKEAADGDNTTKNWLYSIRFLCGFLLPFLVILCCYALVGFGLRRKRFTGKTRTLRILASLVCAFFLCWAPYHCLLLAKMMNSKSDVVKIGLPIAKGFAYFNSCVNPLLYFCMGLDVRSRGRARQSLTGVYRRALTEDEDRRSSQSNADNSVSGTHPLSKRHRGEKDSVDTPELKSKKNKPLVPAFRGDDAKERPWLAGSRRFNPSRRTPRRQPIRRKDRPPTRRLQPRLRLCTPAQCAGHKCRTPRRSSSISRASTPSLPCRQSWLTFRLNVPEVAQETDSTDEEREDGSWRSTGVHGDGWWW